METLIRKKRVQYLCPKCQKALLEQQLLTATVACADCGWSGPETALIATLSDGTDDPTQLLHRFIQEVQVVIAKDLSVPLGRLLLKHGFVEHGNTKLLALYLVETVKAVLGAVIKVYSDDVRAKEKQRVS